MEIAAFVVSLVAITGALISLALSVRADKRAQRAEQREARREEREKTEAAARLRGRPIVTPRGGSGGPTANPVRHDFEVRNAGESTIAELSLWIEDVEGEPISTQAGGAVVLAPGELAHFAVEVRQPLPVEQVLMVRWRDADGEHVEDSGLRPPAHM
jgi:type II secretory pathway pseudopilin PulG